jgi:hypothetical protein
MLKSEEPINILNHVEIIHKQNPYSEPENNPQTTNYYINTDLQIIEELETISKLNFMIGFSIIICPLFFPIWLMNWINFRNSLCTNAKNYARYSCSFLLIWLVGFMMIIWVLIFVLMVSLIFK